MGSSLSTPVHSPPPPELPPLPSLSADTVAHPDLGSISGSFLSDPETGKPLCKRYLGIPYAKPLVKRWTRAEKLEEDFRYGLEGETYDRWGAMCPQRVYGLYSYKNQGWGTPKDDFERQVDENCLQVNIWTPVGPPPKDGWPVLFYIHGGWLQVGDNNQGRRWDPSRLLSEGGLQCVIVAPAYRLNLFGFLACKELIEEGGEGALNLGFWDQRLSLEWAYDHAHFFGGDKNRITVAGLSAGAHSTHFQLIHSIRHPYPPTAGKPLIKGIILYSNAVPSSPQPIATSQHRFDELLKVLEIKSDRPLDALRAVSSEKLVAAMGKMEGHMFRSTQDGADGFCGARGEELKSWANGETGMWCKANGVRVLLGEMDFEEGLFGETNPPVNHEQFYPALLNYYHPDLIASILPLYKLPSPDEKDPQKWVRIFGQVVADYQVYASGRFVVRGLVRGGMTTDDIFRYRINWRPKVLDSYAPPSMGVTHGQDSFVWWYSHSLGVSMSDLALIRTWLDPMQDFFAGRPVDWGTTNLDEQRIITAQGRIVVKKDVRKLEKAVDVLDRLANGSGALSEEGRAAVLRMGM